MVFTRFATIRNCIVTSGVICLMIDFKVVLKQQPYENKHVHLRMQGEWTECAGTLGLSTTGSGLDLSTTGSSLDLSTTGSSLDLSTTGSGLDLSTTGSGLDLSTTGSGLGLSTANYKYKKAHKYRLSGSAT